MPGRFDYVEYDEEAKAAQNRIKTAIMDLEAEIERSLIGASRPKSLAMTALEEVYMWCGKGLRDDQIMRNGSAKLQEERTNS